MKKVVLIFLELNFVTFGILKGNFNTRVLHLTLKYVLMVYLLFLCSAFRHIMFLLGRGKALVGRNTTASHSVCDRLVRPLLVGVYWPVQAFVTFFPTWYIFFIF